MPAIRRHQRRADHACGTDDAARRRQYAGRGRLVSQPEIYVVTSEVRRSADQMDVVAQEASSSRASVADSISTQGSGWKQAGTPGFNKFVEILETQAARLRADLTELGGKLRAAADVYEKQDLEAGGALDSSMGGFPTR
jgi:uncharacterized protein YukE